MTGHPAAELEAGVWGERRLAKPSHICPQVRSNGYVCFQVSNSIGSNCSESSMNYKRGLLGMACIIILDGCAGIAAIEGPGRLERYVNCNTENSMRRASSAGDPTTLAIEAEASCAQERLSSRGCVSEVGR